MIDILEGRRRDHYRELAARVRALTREARFPAARRALLDLAKRFEQGARPEEMVISPTTVDKPVHNLDQQPPYSNGSNGLTLLPKDWAQRLTHCDLQGNLVKCRHKFVTS